MNSVASLVIEQRTRLGLKQHELAERVGVDQRTISHIERNRRKPSIELAIRLAREFGISLDEFWGKAELETAQ